MLPGGLVIHNRRDWPCAVCRSRGISAGRGSGLCLDCAYVIVAAAGSGKGSVRDFLDAVTDALNRFGARHVQPEAAAH